MKDNPKISITAEAVALIRDKEKADKYSKYFITPRIKRLFSISSRLMPEQRLEEIFRKRIKLSKKLDKIIKEINPRQIIELAAGYSTRGLEYSVKKPSVIYIESDLQNVIENKKQILEKIRKHEKLKPNKNHILIDTDILNPSDFNKLKKLVKKTKTLVIAEAVTSYLSPEQHDALNKNVFNFLKSIGPGFYLSHDKNPNKNKTVTATKSSQILRKFVSLISRSKSYSHFPSLNAIPKYFKSIGFKECKIKDKDFFIYLCKI